MYHPIIAGQIEKKIMHVYDFGLCYVCGRILIANKFMLLLCIAYLKVTVLVLPTCDVSSKSTSSCLFYTWVYRTFIQGGPLKAPFFIHRCIFVFRATAL